MSHGYVITSPLTGLADTAFTWSSAYAIGKGRLNDGKLDELSSSALTGQASGQTLVIDMGSAVALVGFALLNHNLAVGSCTVGVRAADNAAISLNVVTAKAASTIVTAAPSQKDTVLQFPSVSKRYWELSFVHIGVKVVTLGEVVALASINALSRTKIYGHGESERYIQNRNESDTGHVRATYVAGPIRTKRLPFRDANVAEQAELMGMFRSTRGGVSNLLWLEFLESTATAATTASQECLWGKIRESHGWTEADFNLFDVDGFELVGLGREVGS